MDSGDNRAALPPSGRRAPGSRAQGLVEFMLVLPLLMVLFLGVIEVARMMIIFSSISSAARQAARYGSVGGETGTGTVYYLDCAGIRNTAARAGVAVGLSTNDIQVIYQRPQGGSFTTIGGCSSSNVARKPLPTSSTAMVEQDVLNGYRIVITVTTQYNVLVPLVQLPSFPFTFVAARTIFPSIEGPTATPKPAPNLSLAMSDAPDPVAPGGTVLYSMAVRNNSTISDSVATTGGVVLTMTVPLNFNYGGTFAGAGWTCPGYSITGGASAVITCTHSSNISVGVTKFLTVTLNTTSSAYGTYTLRSGIRYRDANRTASVTTDVVAGSDLMIAKTDSPDPVPQDSTLSYSILVTNQGPDAITSGDNATVVVTETIPLNTGFPSIGGSGWACANLGGIPTRFRCTRSGTNAALATNASYPPIVLQVRTPLFNTTLSNTTLQVGVQNKIDPIPGNNSLAQPVTTSVESRADLVIAKFDSLDPAGYDDVILYTLRVVNNGPHDALNVILTDTLPTGPTVQSVAVQSAPAGWTCPTINTTQVVCTNPSLAAGSGNQDIVLQVRMPSLAALGGVPAVNLVNVGRVTSDRQDPNPGDNQTAIDTTVLNCHPALVNTTASTLAAFNPNTNPARLEADGASTFDMLVTLVNECGTPMANRSVTLNTTRPGGDVITLQDGTITNVGTTDGNGQLHFLVKSAIAMAPGAANTSYSFTTQSVSGGVTTNVTLPASGNPTSRFLCVDTSALAIAIGPQTVLFEFGNNTTLATRRLTQLRIDLSGAALSGNQALSTVQLGGVVIWSQSGNNGKSNTILIGPGQPDGDFTANVDRTVITGAPEALVLTFNFNVAGRNYTVTPQWDNNAGANVCNSLPATSAK